MRTLWTLSLLLGCVAIGAQPAPDMAERLTACNACHGDAGEGKAGNEYYPHLAGKPTGYLFSQLKAFRDGQRAYAQMNWLMRNMDDGYLERIASHYASLPPRSSAQPLQMEPAARERARALVDEGDPALGVPACSACHGADLAGLEPGVPALLGLPPDYVVAQLGAWRAGARRAQAPDCMAQIAIALQATDLRVLGEYLASQGASHSLKPAMAGSFVLPIACGTPPVGDTP